CRPHTACLHRRHTSYGRKLSGLCPRWYNSAKREVKNGIRQDFGRPWSFGLIRCERLLRMSTSSYGGLYGFFDVSHFSHSFCSRTTSSRIFSSVILTQRL